MCYWVAASAPVNGEDIKLTIYNSMKSQDEVVRVAVYKTVSSFHIELSFYPNLLKSLYKVLRREQKYAPSRPHFESEKENRR